ncbi:DUF4129 domain-containing protein [Haloarchaeobius iranensis]|uniref:Protein-glutamine gamma-glutamyltransferase-like C-terminal domain-containing protein n=1 Tax=Haloarchaeobius iranensis TaxID=996166 RepID=A0A1G9UCF0_9EURY|nr:DUF4129 domain-containing protein [Haloarchaeobius iranensis]SDM57641.1 protein of unknown function [Haloarchaeobius iranensis]
MGYDLSRAVLVVVSVLTVLLAASLFPASGYGTYPGTVGDGFAEPSDSNVPADVEGPAGTVENPDTTTRATQGPAATETTVGANSPEQTTDSQTADPTATTDQQDDDTGGATGPDRGDGFPIFSFLLQLFVLFLCCAVVVAVLAVIADVERQQTGEFDGYVVDLPVLPTFRVRASFLAIPQGTMSVLVGLTASAPQVLDGLGRTAGGLFAGLDDLASGIGKAFVAVPRTLGKGLVAIPRGLGSGLGSLSLGLSSLTAGLSTRDWLSRRGDKPDDPRDGARTDTDADGEPVDQGPVSIDEAWETMVDSVPLRRAESKTPAEVARAAVDGGLPRSAVERLTAVFRDVRYGRYPRSDERKRTAREALAEIRDRLEGDG